MLFKKDPPKTPIQKILRFIGPAFLMFVSVALIIFTLNNPEKVDLDDTARNLAPGQFADLPTAITHYEIAGPDSAQTIVLVHGFSIPQYVWDGTFEVLINQGYRVVRYDLVGRGFSSRPNVLYTKEIFRNQLSELIEELELQKPVHLVGLSFGGAVVSDFTVTYPDLVDKVIFIDPIVEFPDLMVPKSFLGLYYGMIGNNTSEFALRGIKYPDRFPGWTDKFEVQMQYRGFRDALVSTIYDYDADIKANYEQLGNSDREIQLFWGMEDSVVDYELSGSIGELLQTEVKSIPDANHLPHLEQPVQVHRSIIQFLEN